MANVLDDLSLTDIIEGVILLKPGKPYFKEEALYFGFKKLSEREPRYQALFIPCGDGTSPEPNTGLENTLSFMMIAYHLRDTGDWQYVFMTPHGRIFIEKHLTGTYGDNILGAIQPIADEVWKYAREYEARRKSEF